MYGEKRAALEGAAWGMTLGIELTMFVITR